MRIVAKKSRYPSPPPLMKGFEVAEDVGSESPRGDSSLNCHESCNTMSGLH
jgi:hypothetical protein